MNTLWVHKPMIHTQSLNIPIFFKTSLLTGLGKIRQVKTSIFTILRVRINTFEVKYV